MWDVHDISAALTMDDFYAQLAAGLPVGPALAAAQCRARQRDASPLRWAPFMVVGNPWTRLPAAGRAAVA
jgi:CHAT domain-containing protein